jgi:hypothetical protein
MVSISDVVLGVFAEAESTREAGKVAGVLLAYPGLNIEVSGYTDNVGGDAMNQNTVRKPRRLSARLSGATGRSLEFSFSQRLR